MAKYVIKIGDKFVKAIRESGINTDDIVMVLSNNRCAIECDWAEVHIKQLIMKFQSIYMDEFKSVPIIKVGNRYKMLSDNATYIAACVDYDSYVAISLENGNRFKNACSDLQNIFDNEEIIEL